MEGAVPVVVVSRNEIYYTSLTDLLLEVVVEGLVVAV